MSEDPAELISEKGELILAVQAGGPPPPRARALQRRARAAPLPHLPRESLKVNAKRRDLPRSLLAELQLSQAGAGGNGGNESALPAKPPPRGVGVE